MSHRLLARLGLVLALGLLLVCVPACVKQKDETKLKKDGSGTVKLTMDMDLTNQEEIQGTMAGLGLGGGGGGDIAEMFDPETIKAGAENVEGLRVTSATREISEDKTKLKVVIEAEFDNLEVLSKSGAFRIPEIDVALVTMALAKLEDGNYVLQRRVLGDVMPDTGGDPEAEAMLEAMLGMFETFLSGMELRSVIELPTRIIETNGEQGTGNTVTWKVGFKDLSNTAKRTQTVVFSGEGLEWKPFGGKIVLPRKEAPAEEGNANENKPEGEKEGADAEDEKEPQPEPVTPGK